MKKKTWGIHTFMAIPAFLLFAVFFLYPLGRGLQMSLTNWDGIGKAEFIGLGNFRSFFTDKRAMGDIRNTLLFALGSAPLLNIVGLGYALLMNGRFRGKSLARMFILYAGDNQPADHGLYLVSAAAAGKRLLVSSA